MNQSSKTHKQKRQTGLPEQPTKTHRRKKQPQHQPSFRRNPLQDLNNGGIDSTSIDNTSNASSLSSIEAPKGCLRFFLSQSSSSRTAKTPFNNSSNNQRLIKVKPFSSKTPTSAPDMMGPPKENSSRQNLFERPISKKVEKVKRNHPPCLYQWQSGKKRTCSRNEIANAKVSSFSESSGSLVNNKLKSGSGELKKVIIDGVYEGSEANLTPLCKVASGSGLNLGADGKVMNDDFYEKSSNCNTDSKSTSSNTKTPPVQPSVSPEIQCGSSMKLMTGKPITPATCYGAGHVVSGVTDKRKCRPRGILACGEAKALGSFDSDEDIEQENDIALVENSALSVLPSPIEASMHWLLSPCDEEDEDQKENSRNKLCGFQRLEVRAMHNSPASISSGYGGFSPNLCNTSANRSISTVSAGSRRSASLLSPSELPLPEFQGFLGTPLCDDFAVSPLEEETNNRRGLDGENSPFSIGSLGSGNVIQTPQSDSSSDRRVGASWLQVDGNRKKCSFDSELISVAEHLQMTSLSPKSHASIWDPTNSSFRFDSLTMPSNSVDLSKFHKILDDRASWFSNSTIENVSQSQMRISWREGLVSRIFEMDEFDCCRYLSDEEHDGSACKIDCSKSHKSPELNVDAATDRISINCFGSTEYVMKEQGTGDKTKDSLPSQPPCSCAESISTDGGGLVCSDDSDWTLCYKNHLFQCYWLARKMNERSMMPSPFSLKITGCAISKEAKVTEYIDLPGCGPGTKSQLHDKVDDTRCVFANIGLTLSGSLAFEGKGRTKHGTGSSRCGLMEGLIPLVYKAFMKKKTRSQYECLSSGAARGYNISDFYVHEAPKSELHLEPSMEKKTYQKKGHQRYFSVHGDFSGGFSSLADRSTAAASPQTKRLVRFRSQRV